MRAIEYILLISVLMLGMLLFWPIVTDLAMSPLRPLMDDGIWSYLRLMIPFALSVLTLSLILKGLGTGMDQLLLERDRKDGERKTAASVFMILLLLFVSTSFLSPTMEKTGYPGSLTFLSLARSIVFIPLQVFAEELMFRVIPARMFFPEGFGNNKVADMAFVVASGLLFAAMHGMNPEVTGATLKWVIMLNYFASGLFLALFAVMTKGFLTGIAYHAAVNLYVSVFVNLENGVIPSYSFYVDRAQNYEVTSLFSTVAASLVTILIITLTKKNGRNRKEYGKSKSQESLQG